MLAEARRLHTNGLSYKRMRELGLEYRFLADLFEKKISKEVFITDLLSAINHYARRQMTWFRRNKDTHWFLPRDTRAIEKEVKEFIG
jgi:tRNA dimethylallyltransferase